ncbi:uncharacterized protein ASCRUDRAFT_8308 [Ascoidea rubescens DSM 1968]|uniref:Uncharacterized protein n=1 Tax=Ascoidea rubescens DSM 1968 TaxID=1344418 RepID=A0A1D2VGB1_9ASCO|nr:hypothetical protein ASCRUDRAFT_8308 [Ascoidea rubescens DSM 1968]ODV60701.1 hypothetical protein ASCRUDRAFT_8308 [Ascoidea rubescens DSM 1968]
MLDINLYDIDQLLSYSDGSLMESDKVEIEEMTKVKKIKNTKKIDNESMNNVFKVRGDNSGNHQNSIKANERKNDLKEIELNDKKDFEDDNENDFYINPFECTYSFDKDYIANLGSGFEYEIDKSCMSFNCAESNAVSYFQMNMEYHINNLLYDDVYENINDNNIKNDDDNDNDNDKEKIDYRDIYSNYENSYSNSDDRLNYDFGFDFNFKYEKPIEDILNECKEYEESNFTQCENVYGNERENEYMKRIYKIHLELKKNNCEFYRRTGSKRRYNVIGIKLNNDTDTDNDFSFKLEVINYKKQMSCLNPGYENKPAVTLNKFLEYCEYREMGEKVKKKIIHTLDLEGVAKNINQNQNQNQNDNFLPNFGKKLVKRIKIKRRFTIEFFKEKQADENEIGNLSLGDHENVRIDNRQLI